MVITLPSIFPVACHTDQIGPGSIFVAIKGMHDDGIAYIPLALQKGATTIVIEDDVHLLLDLMQLIKKYNAKLITVPNTRGALAELSAQAVNFPAKKLKIIGITGTKGKTTTSFLIEHLLAVAGYKTALLSSVYNKIENTIFKTSLTTPHPDYLHIFFDVCLKAGVEYVVMEVAAQALSLHRTEGIAFDAVFFTNFDLEHSEFYHSLDEYFAAKCLLFKQVKIGAPQIVNADDQWCQKIVEKYKDIQTVGFKNQQAMVQGILLQNNADGLKIRVATDVYRCRALLGEFNAYNMLTAIALVQQLGISVKQIQNGLLSFTGVPGRLQMHALPKGARCFIDKAHNPSSYRAVLGALRQLTNHLIVVFGAGGDRDKTKRPLMGKIAAELCDVVIVTSDDPRSEDPATIIQDVLVGIPRKYQHKVIREIDREHAIKKAYELSRPDSIVALLGKGTDEYQLINGEKHYFSEREIIQTLR